MLQGDGNGIVTIPLWTAAGDFSISGFFEHTPNTEIFLGYNSASNEYIGQISNNTISIQVGAGTAAVASVPNGENIPFTLSRGGTTVSYDFNNGEVTGSFTSASPFRLDRFLTYNNGTLKYRRKLSGIWTMIGDPGGTRTYNMEGSGDTLVDTTSSQNGTLSGFTTGGFTAPSRSINITSVADYHCIKEDANHQAVFTISGSLTGTTPPSIMVVVGDADAIVLDDSPSATFSGTVTITDQQNIVVSFSDEPAINQTRLALTASYNIAAAGQSNQMGAGAENQSVTVSGNNPIPIMYQQGQFLPLTDPTNFAALSPRGSMWPRITQRYSDDGVAVCVGNVAEGGSTISSWSTVGQNFNRITQFADAVGGLSLINFLIGESDSAAGTTPASYKSDYLTILTALNDTYNVGVFVSYFPVGTSTGTPENVNAIRSQITELIDENAFVFPGADLSVIDISSAVDPVNDNLHLRTNAALTEGADLQYDAFTFVESTLSFTVTGLSNTTRSVKFFDWATGSFIKTETITFDSGGSANTTLNVEPATVVFAGYLGANPPATGSGIYGVTA